MFNYWWNWTYWPTNSKKLFLDAGANIKVISLDNINLDPKILHINGDLTDYNFCLEQTKDMDCIFHVAGIKGSVKVTKGQPASFCALC